MAHPHRLGAVIQWGITVHAVTCAQNKKNKIHNVGWWAPRATTWGKVLVLGMKKLGCVCVAMTTSFLAYAVVKKTPASIELTTC